jgi:hypothetical protein
MFLSAIVLINNILLMSTLAACSQKVVTHASSDHWMQLAGKDASPRMAIVVAWPQVCQTTKHLGGLGFGFSKLI